MSEQSACPTCGHDPAANEAALEALLENIIGMFSGIGDTQLFPKHIPEFYDGLYGLPLGTNRSGTTHDD